MVLPAAACFINFNLKQKAIQDNEQLEQLTKFTVLNPYTAERRDVLGNTSPEKRQVSRGRDFARQEFAQGPRVMYFPTQGSVRLFYGRRGCVPDIRPRERIKKYCPLGCISQYTPLGAGIVLNNVISVDLVIQYNPRCQ